MKQSRPIAIDHSQETATSQVLPAEQRFRCKTGLTGFYLESHHSPAHETPEHYPTQHVVAIQTAGAVQSERRLEGQFRREFIVTGDICVVPAHTRHWIRSEGEQGLIFISFEPVFLNQVIPESVDPDSVEILPQFAKPDPLVYQLGLSIEAALRTD